MSGSSDERAYIWNTRGAELSVNAVKPFVALSSHSAEVTCVEMSPDNLVVSFNFFLRIIDIDLNPVIFTLLFSYFVF